MFRSCLCVLRDISNVTSQWRLSSSKTVSAMQPHMRRAVREITERLPSVDVVIEMRDARIPFTSANYTLTEMVKRRQNRILVLNKRDLANKQFHKVCCMLEANLMSHKSPCSWQTCGCNVCAGNSYPADCGISKRHLYVEAGRYFCNLCAGCGEIMSSNHTCSWASICADGGWHTQRRQDNTDQLP